MNPRSKYTAKVGINTWTRLMKLECGSPTCLSTSSLESTFSQKLYIIDMPTIPQSKSSHVHQLGHTFHYRFWIYKWDATTPAWPKLDSPLHWSLLDLYPKINPARLAKIIQTLIVEEKYTPKDPPPYVAALFSPWGRSIMDMISSVLGYTTSEYIDEIILAFISIYTPGQPPAVIYDYA